jgi:hypothetical protein
MAINVCPRWPPPLLVPYSLSSQSFISHPSHRPISDRHFLADGHLSSFWMFDGQSAHSPCWALFSFWTSSSFCCPKGLDDRMGLNEWESWANVAHRMHKKLRIILTPHGLAEHIMGLAHIGCSDCIIFPLPPPNTNGYWTKLDDDRNCLLYSSAD